MGIIDKARKKIKIITEHHLFDEVMWVTIIMFALLGSFSLGMIYERKAYSKHNPIAVKYSEEAISLWSEYQLIKSQNQGFFASKNGSVVYPVGCSKGNRIKDENKIYFGNLEQALSQGYREAKGC